MRVERVGAVRVGDDNFDRLMMHYASVSASQVTPAAKPDNGQDNAVGEAMRALPNLSLKRGSRWFVADVQKPSRKKANFRRVGQGEHGELYDPVLLLRRRGKEIEPIPGTSQMELPIMTEKLRRHCLKVNDLIVQIHIPTWLASLATRSVTDSRSPAGARQAKLERARLYFAIQRQLRRRDPISLLVYASA